MADVTLPPVSQWLRWIVQALELGPERHDRQYLTSAQQLQEDLYGRPNGELADRALVDLPAEPAPLVAELRDFLERAGQGEITDDDQAIREGTLAVGRAEALWRERLPAPPEWLFPLVGRIANRGAELEAALLRLVAALDGGLADHDGRMEVIRRFGTQTRRLLDRARELAPSPDPGHGGLGELLEETGHVLDDRNDVVHTVWQDQGPGGAFALGLKWSELPSPRGTGDDAEGKPTAAAKARAATAPRRMFSQALLEKVEAHLADVTRSLIVAGSLLDKTSARGARSILREQNQRL